MVLRGITIVRHGQSAANVAAAAAEAAGSETVMLPWRDADVPLTGLGERQSTAIGGWLARLPRDERPDQFWVSPYRRAHQTARLIQAAVRDADPAASVPPLRFDERLRDHELGILDGLTWSGVRNRLPDEADRRRRWGPFFHRPPGGESWADVALRIRSLLVDLEGQGAERMFLVAHDAVVWLLRYVLEQLSETELVELNTRDPIRNASVSDFVRAGPESLWRSTVFNSTAHLAGVTDG